MSAPGLVSRNTITIERSFDVEGRSLWTDARRRLVKNRAALTSIVILGVIALMAVFVPFFWPYGYADIDYGNIACAPDWWPGTDVACRAGGYHIFGMDQNGRDLFIRVLYGARVSLSVGFVATLVSLVIGVSYGAIAGFVGGRLDEMMMRFVDILYSLPYIFLVIILMVVFNQNFFLL
ncbi:MAG: ABC transporter permease, partial [Rhizomicrobium sp.]